MAYPLIHLLHCQKKITKNTLVIGLCVLHSEIKTFLLFGHPSVSDSNITLKNKFYTISHISRGIPQVFLDLSLGWKEETCLSWSILKEASLIFFCPNLPFQWGTLNTPSLLFSDSWPCPFIVVWDSQMLKCNLSGILWPLFLRSFTQGEEAQFSPPEPVSISELGMESHYDSQIHHWHIS